MKRKQLLFTLLLALMVPLAANAQVERTVTVYNGNDINAHIPVDGGHGTIVPAKSQFIMDKADLSDLAGKQITKMTFHVVDPNITMKTGDHLPYSVLLAEVDVTDFGNAGLLTENLTNAHTVASGIQLELTGNTLVINFDRAYTYSGNKNLLVQFSCSSATNYFTPFYESYELRFYGVNATRAGVANMGMGIYRHYGFVPKTTFTYLDEATWANTNRPQNLQVSAHEDGYRLDVSWQAPANYSGSYQVLCVAHGTTPNWSNAEITTNTSTYFSQLNTNTAYDIYVRAKSAVMFSAPAKAIAMTKHIANLDNGNLILDFEGAFVPNGVTATGAYSHRLDISRYWYTDFGYGSYHMQCPIGTVNLPSLAYQDANNGVIMEFDLNNATGLQVQFYKQGYTTTLGTFSATGWTHYTVRAEGLGAQNTAYFQLVSSNAFDIDNVVIRKASDVMPVTNLAASNIGENGATISWTDPNINTHSLALFYRPKGFTGGDWYRAINVTGTSYTLTELSPYTQYEVMVQAYNTSVLENSAILTFATACPATQTTYTQSFTNLSDLPQYWRVEKGNGVTYSVNNDRLTVSNTSYEYTSYGYTFTSYTTLDAYVIMPYFENLQSLQLSFKAGRTAGSYNELVVGVMSDPFNISTFSILETRVLNGPSTTYNFNLANAAYTHGYIAIKLNHYENNLQNVWFDDFVVTQYAAPTDLTVSNITKTTATLDWNCIAPEYEISYKKSTDSNWTIVTTTDNHYTLSNLSRDTQYQAKIKAKYGENLYSTEVSFADFKTYYYEPVVISSLTGGLYSQDFNGNSIGDWELINGSCRNKWVRQNDTGLGSGTTDKCVYISNTETAGQVMDWAYTVCDESQLSNLPVYSTTYFTKVFTLTPGSYQFSYKYAVNAVANSDYMRVLLVPANTTFEPGNYMPTGLNYVNEPEGWIAIDGGAQLTNQSASLGWRTMNISVDVYPGGDAEPGDYKMVFVWHNDGRTRPYTVDYDPVALDDVEIQWSSLIDPPSGITAVESDTQADLTWTAPSSGFTPTGYQVQYEPLGNNGFNGAPIVDANTNSVTLTGLTPYTNYQVRVRSFYTSNNNTLYSDWTDAVAFTTLMAQATDLTVELQTTNRALVFWTPVEMELASNQAICYSWQLTTIANNWGTEHDGMSSAAWESNLAVGSYYFRVRAKLLNTDNNTFVATGAWSEPIQFTIAPWSDPVTTFPLTYDFEMPTYLPDGMTLAGALENFSIETHVYSGVSAHEGSESQRLLRFNSGANEQAYLVLPPLHPSTVNASVSFWWYHHNGHVNNSNTSRVDGVEVETSTDGQIWTTVSYGVISRYDDDYSGWKKYDFVFPATANPTYVRLHFYGTTGNYLYCYLDDLKVNNFESYQPCIYDVYCGNTTTADITLYDYGYDNGWPSSAFQVQYREYREPGQQQEQWTTYPSLFNNTEPYSFINTLQVNGLQPTTLYEFRACARVSHNNFDFPWSSYCEPYRQWTGCGTCTITPNHNYTVDFEDTFYLDCWTADGGWTMQHSGGYNGSDYCAYHATGSIGYMTSPEIDFSGCNNVIFRFWSKGKGVVWVYYGEDYANHNQLYISDTNDWTMIELSLCYFMDKGPVKLVFTSSINSIWYVDDVSILANVYNVKIYDKGSINSGGFWDAANNWFPNGVPTENNDVLVMSTANVTGANGFARTIDFGVSTGNLVVTSNGVLTATTVNASQESQFEVKGIANVTTLNAGEANSVIVKEGGVLNATTITVTNAGANSSVVIKDGGQVKTANSFYGAIEKNITGYGAANVNDNKGYYLIATPAEETINRALVPKNGNTYLFNQVDVYQFNQLYELEWDNLKCSLEGGCEGLDHINQGEIHGNTLMQHKKGYLYARQNDGTVRMEAGPVGNSTFPATTTDVDVSSLVYSASASFAGWNLIGNPFTCNAFVKVGDSYISYYRMNSTGDQIVLADYDDPIKPCEGVFVQCTSDLNTRTVTFSSTAPGRGNSMDITVRGANTRSADIIDRARITFGEGQNLAHLDLMANPNRLYIPLKDKAMAVVHSAPVGEMPLNFEAAENGTFTLDVNVDEAELLYCHLIDNLTGNDVNLLQQPEYTFDAKRSDYASRFKVVFVAQEDGSSTGLETFAFNNNGNWIIANEGRATVQVIDINGRILSSEEINGCAETRINAAAGVYMIRLINGESVRVQKVVVR